MDYDPTKQIGVIDDIRLDTSQRKLRASARFGNSEQAREVYADVVDRIRTNVSIGYHVNKYVQQEAENRSETPIFRVTDWTLLEVSSVSIPSDFEVGAFRSNDSKPSHHRITHHWKWNDYHRHHRSCAVLGNANGHCSMLPMLHPVHL